MRLLEKDCKELFSRYSIDVPRGIAVRSGEEASRALSQLGAKSVLKVQIPTGRRGKAGGIVQVSSEEESKVKADELLSSEFYGYKTESLLVEEFVLPKREVFVGAALDRSRRTMTFLSSPHGGMEVEEMARKHPESLLKVSADPLLGLMPFEARGLAKNAAPSDEKLRRTVNRVISLLWRIVKDVDAVLIEINPLAVTEDDRVVALDARIELDDNALFRQKEFLQKAPPTSGRERIAKEKGIAYVELEGNIGTLANGAGMAMATTDLVHLEGGGPANFCDIGGGASASRVRAAVELIASNPRVEVILVNALCGITSGVEVAEGILEAVKTGKIRSHFVVRLSGNLAREGREMLAGKGIKTLEDAQSAVRSAIDLASR